MLAQLRSLRHAGGHRTAGSAATAADGRLPVLSRLRAGTRCLVSRASARQRMRRGILRTLSIGNNHAGRCSWPVIRTLHCRARVRTRRSGAPDLSPNLGNLRPVRTVTAACNGFLQLSIAEGCNDRSWRTRTRAARAFLVLPCVNGKQCEIPTAQGPASTAATSSAAAADGRTSGHREAYHSDVDPSNQRGEMPSHDHRHADRPLDALTESPGYSPSAYASGQSAVRGNDDARCARVAQGTSSRDCSPTKPAPHSADRSGLQCPDAARRGSPGVRRMRSFGPLPGGPQLEGLALAPCSRGSPAAHYGPLVSRAAREIPGHKPWSNGGLR